MISAVTLRNAAPALVGADFEALYESNFDSMSRRLNPRLDPAR